MNFKHNDRVTCKIFETKITDARISIDKDGTPFICQNERGYAEPEDNLGYKNAWVVGDTFYAIGLEDLKLATTTWDTLSWKDIVLDEHGRKRMVLAVQNDSVLISLSDEFETTSAWYHKKELQRRGYTIEGAVPALEEITIAEAEARLGVKIKTDQI